jgi:hypothetical protein
MVRLATADLVAIRYPTDYFERTFGDVRIVVGAPRPPQGLPGWPVLYVGGERISEYPRLLAQEVYASPDRRYFLLLSNLGLSSYAAAVIDREGHIVLSTPHNANPFVGDLLYCQMSITNTREWINLKDANARFTMDGDNRLKSVAVKGCDGNDVVVTQPE